MACATKKTTKKAKEGTKKKCATKEACKKKKK